MKIRQLLDRQVSALVAAVGLLAGIAAPALLPVTAMAAPITSRSITMSSSARGATGVSYQLQFTAASAVAASGGVVIDFCDDTPIVNIACGTSSNPVDASSAILGTVRYNGTAAGSTGSITKTATNIKWTVGSAFAAGDIVQVTFNGIKNPVNVGTFYARVVTYANSIDFGGYGSPTSLGSTHADDGGIALSTTDNVDITAYVAETLTFCVSSTAPDYGCAGSIASPNVQLGEDPGNGVKVLNASVVSTGVDYAQLSTNASKGAVVNLHSSTLGCGGLVRAGASNCDIAPQNTAGSFVGGAGKFGLKVGPSQNPTTGASGAIVGDLASANGYNATEYFIHYVTGDATGVTSTYGSELFNSGGVPVSNKTMPLTFGATAANNTPAGIYKASLNLIATGTF